MVEDDYRKAQKLAQREYKAKATVSVSGLKEK